MAQTKDNSDSIDQLREGHDAAWEELVSKYAGRLLATARRLLRDEQRAEDVVQEAFLVAWKDLGRFRGASQVYTWLYRILVNLCLMEIRSSAKKTPLSIDSLLPQFTPEGLLQERESSWPNPADELERAELRQRIIQTVEKLPDPYRVVVVLRDLEGLSADEVSKILDASKEQVKVRLHRARQALKTLLERETSN